LRTIDVVIGSTRPTRICPGIAQWIVDAVGADSPLHYELLDLAQVDLPFLDEPLMAALGQYEHEHTRAWSRTVMSYVGFIFVFPQYNWGYPAPLKNALDFLYAEWNGKPATSVTYGTRGGGRAAEQFQSVLSGLHMEVLADRIEVKISADDIDEQRQLKDISSLLEPYRAQTRAIDVQIREVLGTTSAGPSV
jgi:NAD(P)H-dependent FMN reductase